MKSFFFLKVSETVCKHQKKIEYLFKILLLKKLNEIFEIKKKKSIFYLLNIEKNVLATLQQLSIH